MSARTTPENGVSNACRFFLHRRRHVRIQVRSDADSTVPEHVRHDFQRLPVFEVKGRRSVPELMEAHVR